MDLRLVLTDSFQRPTRVKVCEGMCNACAADGAIVAYRSAAAFACGASAGTSYAWMM